MQIAKTLVLFALYMQQLPTTFDEQLLGSQDVSETVALILERVKAFIASREEEGCSLEGIECLLLISLVHLNEFDLRKAWTAFRTVLNNSRLSGIHHSFSPVSRESSDSEAALRRRLWLSAVGGDCYCSLLLGLEPDSGLSPFGPDNGTLEERPMRKTSDGNHTEVQRRLCLVVARIARRNTLGLHHDVNQLRAIDLALDNLSDSLPSSWWKTPSFRPDRSLDSAEEPNRLTFQLWLYQARMFAHFPLAVKDDAEGTVESIESCMEAARITLHRYLGLQHARDQLSRCRTIEQSALTAAVVLLVTIVHIRQHKSHRVPSSFASDLNLLEQIANSFELLGNDPRKERVRRQGAELLSSMLRIADSDSIWSDQGTGAWTHPAPVHIQLENSAVNSGLRDMILSSISPMIVASSPASRLISLTFESLDDVFKKVAGS